MHDIDLPAVSNISCHVDTNLISGTATWRVPGCAPTTWSPLIAAACPSKKPTASRRRRPASPCRATAGGGDDDGSVLRRDVLAGLGVRAAALAVYGLESGLLEVDSCSRGDKINATVVECTDPNRGFPCPPAPSVPAADFFSGSRRGRVTRVRRPVHLLTLEEQEKYKEAVGKMRALQSCNPLSFSAQAAIHQAYCDGHYRYDPTKKNAPFDVHFSWIFAPWHRMYIYFYEKALGDLIGDDTFALPYWNWDAPAGMVVPDLFVVKDNNNPLYDRNRNHKHLDKLVNLDKDNQTSDSDLIPFYSRSRDANYKEQVLRNLCLVYQQQIRLGTDPRSFLGEKLCTQMERESPGTLESMAHTAMHIWVGRSGPPPESCTAKDGGFLDHDDDYICYNDMGFLGTGGPDPLFYSHHANVDRLWHLWSTVLGGKGFNDTEWLDASFDFYENHDKPRLVRVKIRDVLDTRDLGYTYDAESDKELPWRECKLTSLVPPGGALSLEKKQRKNPVFPVTLRKDQVVEVPGVAVPPANKQQRLLVIQGIEYDPQAEHKFDVAFNVPGADALKVGPEYNEYAGSFSVVPSSKEGGGTLRGKIALCIDQVLEDIRAGSDSTVDVVIVPRTEAKIKLKHAPKIQVVRE